MEFQYDEVIASISKFKTLAFEQKHQDAEKEVGKILRVLLEEYCDITQTPMARDNGIDYIVRQGNSKIGVEVKALKANLTLNNVASSIVQSTINSLDRLIIISSSPFTKHLLSSVERFNPVEVQLFDIEGLNEWAFNKKQLFESTKEKKQIKSLVKKAVSSLSRRLIQIISDNGEEALEFIEWRQLESIVAEVFSTLGFETELTPSSKDGGKDVIVSYKRNKYLIEIKHWKAPNKVGSNELSDFLQVIVNEKSEGGLFLSTSGYCSNAFEQLKVITKKPVNYQGARKIISLIETYEKYQSGIWTKPLDIEELLFE